MPSRLRLALTPVVLAMVLSITFLGVSAEEKGLNDEQKQITDTVSTMFSALRTDDIAKFESVTASDFYIFDGGARLNGQGITALLKAQHAAGEHYEWNVTEPDVHLSGNIAWIAYINNGSITDASGTTNQKWLESAFLQRQAGIWKIVFMHSTRVPMISQQSHVK